MNVRGHFSANNDVIMISANNSKQPQKGKILKADGNTNNSVISGVEGLSIGGVLRTHSFFESQKNPCQYWYDTSKYPTLLSILRLQLIRKWNLTAENCQWFSWVWVARTKPLHQDRNHRERCPEARHEPLKCIFVNVEHDYSKFR